MSSRPKSQKHTVTDVPHINLATTQICRQTLDTSSQEWNPPMKNAKMQSHCHGGRLSIEVMNTASQSHTENMLNGQFIYMYN